MALVGQDALESAWGTHSHSDVYNFGNIHAYKGWEGKVKKGFDHDADGKKYATKFMAFDSLQDYVNKKWQMLTN